MIRRGRGRWVWPAVAAVVLAAGCGSGGGSGSQASPSPSAPPAATAPLFGVTVDDVSDLARLTAAVKALPERPTVRVVFDVGHPADYYLPAVRELSADATVMGQLLDSASEEELTAAALAARARQFMAVLGPYVGIWEVGNEVNGSWLGSYADVSAKLQAAYQQIAAGGGRTALTLYANGFGPDNCGDGTGELTPEQFSTRYVPASIRQHLNYVLLSYYPDQCGGIEPSTAVVGSTFAELHALYPSSALGFGEIGMPDAATRSTAAHGAQVMAWAYSLNPGLTYYVGGYFWWYGAEDALGPNRPLTSALDAGFRSEAAALG